MRHSSFAPEGTHSPQGPPISRRVVNSYAGQRASGSGCERLVSTKFFRIATSKPNTSEVIPGLEINENGCNFKDFKKMSAGSNLDSFPSFDKRCLCSIYFHRAFGDGKPRVILPYVLRRTLCGEAHLLRPCREQAYNSAGAWSNR